MTKILWLFLVGAAAWPAAGEILQTECAAVDLRPLFGPVRDQGGTGWCFAMTVADHIGFALRVPPEDPVSALYVTAVYFGASVEEHRAAGVVPREERIARMSEFPLWERSGGNPDELVKLYAHRGRLCLESQIPTPMPPGGYASLDDKEGVLFIHRELERYRGGAAGDQGLTESIRAAGDAACRPHPLVPDLRYQETSESLLENAQTLLNQRRPFMLHYNASLWSGAPEAGGKHVATVVGRRWSGGKCEFLIRDSFGPNLADCANGAACEGGHVWIPADPLMTKSRAIGRIVLP